jgi:hypothetical protein
MTKQRGATRALRGMAQKTRDEHAILIDESHIAEWFRTSLIDFVSLSVSR